VFVAAEIAEYTLGKLVDYPSYGKSRIAWAHASLISIDLESIL
jgi:hypothetical protein